ncbi:hypothetical protein GCM10011613_35160 [Cellvibrio zantedeschiae]|uniref:Uncharacterized protein n=1 Tax=Cellvibrio zantedeschiae TaxID=1237077 RepID=A0ABQ3BAJ5_9GAMM|nr:hypothetical protein [Cellvibrio zantedeschiae]GGY86931.1 hypothetical protein GCM10011613_35160 [Cellvibrio zantedeschiae]
MRSYRKSMAKIFTVFLSLVAATAIAQDSAAPKKKVSEAEVKQDANTAIQKTDLKADAATVKTNTATGQPAKKMVQDATINLQTTITGNQEQPRVLYILPWQSPQTADVDFEPLDNQQKAVFGHVEREELRRELESAGELQ